MVFKGLSKSLSTPSLQPKVLIVEFWPFGLVQSGGTVDDLLSYVDNHDYLLWDIGRWQDKPKRTSVEILRLLAASELKPESTLFTNIIMILVKENNLIKQMDAMCI